MTSANQPRRADALVGRAPELAVLRSALDDTADGMGRLVLLVGEPGIGKTRLAQELAGWLWVAARVAVVIVAVVPPSVGPPAVAGGRCGQDVAVDEVTEGQLSVIRDVLAVMRAADIPAWLFGGWGLDARIGRITREHGDVEFWVEHLHAERSKAVLVGAGATALKTQPPEESCEFIWDGVPFSTAYFDRQPDGSCSQLRGRWSDWQFPPGSFGDEPGTLDGTPVPAMSVAGMLAMKEQFPHLRNGRPWRRKDIEDIEILRGLGAEDGADGHSRAT